MLGEIEVNEKEIITFPQGLIGLENKQQFILLDVPENPFFKWLQSVEDTTLTFLVTNPFQFVPNYEFEIKASDKELLVIENSDDVATFVIVTVPDNEISKITANLLGPVVVNSKNKRAKQLVLSDDKYSTKVYLFQQNASTNSQEATAREACR